MNYIPVIIVIAITLCICYLAEKGFSAFFRGKTQHKSGLSVKASKRYATIGLIIAVLGVAALASVRYQGVLLLIAGIVMLVLGALLIVYFLSFGIYYDEDSFIYSTFGKKSKTYRFDQIISQQLYASGSSLIIELHLDDDRSIQLQSAMSGVVKFMNVAFAGWCRQKGICMDDCSFYDPQNSCWFPNAQEEQ